MAYEVLARRWRPQQFADVVGQDHVSTTLINAIKSERVAHAYLFVGPRGTGKTTTARILAKCLNCEKGPTSTPCDTCSSCKEIMTGTHFDVMEYDAASNTQVDKIREILDAVYFAPAKGPYKIYIVDEVHMLSAGSFNALLKTLEEPPAHVKFIFATTEPQKVPATILSRCQRFDLRRIDASDIMGRLREIVDKEGITIDDPALAAIARGAEGGMRDAQSALDQLISFKGKSIAEEDVLSVFGLVAGDTLYDMAEAVLKGHAENLLQRINELDHIGKDLHRLVQELIVVFRDVLVWQYTQSETLLNVPDIQAARVQALADSTDPGRLFGVLDILTDTESRIRYALSRKILLETALVKACRSAQQVSIDELISRVDALQAGAPAVAAPSPVEPIPPAAKPAAPKPKKPVASAPPPAAPAEEKPVTAVPEGDLGLLHQAWPGLVGEICKAAPLMKNLLSGSAPVEVDGAAVSIGVENPSDEIFQSPRYLKAFKKKITPILGRDVDVVFKAIDGLDVPIPKGDGNQKKKSVEAPPNGQGNQRWIEDPTVRKALEMFNGDITQVKEEPPAT